MNWWERGEWSDERGDASAPPDNSAQGGSDVLNADQSVAAMEVAPLGEPLTDFDVRSVYDSRPVNGYDFNFTQSNPIINTGTGFSWSVQFDVPNGYRAVPLDWSVEFSPPLMNNGLNAAFDATNNIASIQQNNASLPNNANIVIGETGTGEDIETFFLCEENTTFGLSGFSPFTVQNNPTYVIVHVHGNLIPVSEVALPFAIANRKYGT